MLYEPSTNPSVLARETLRQLVIHKFPPTPENYHMMYEKIAGNAVIRMDQNTVNLFSELVKELPRDTLERLRIASALEQATIDKDWLKFKTTIIRLIINTSTITDAQTKAHHRALEADFGWGETIAIILKQLEINHGTLTIAKKRESLNQVLSKYKDNPTQLHNRLLALVDSWTTIAYAPNLPIETKEPITPSSNKTINHCSTESSTSAQTIFFSESAKSSLSDQLQKLLIQLLDYIAAIQPVECALASEAKLLSRRVGVINDQQAFDEFIIRFKQFCHDLELHGEIGTQLHQKQDFIKNSLDEAKITLKQMVSCLIDSIDALSDSTGEYHDKIELYSIKINQTEDISELNQLLAVIISETKKVQSRMQNSRVDFFATRADVITAQSKIQQLESELLQMGEKIHEDHLTGILNRRGLDSAFDRESSRAIRLQKPLSIALLDIDNFKKLNDTHGHQVGDNVLVYLVEAVKEATRPDDIVARFGGEEFIILMPDTNNEQAILAISKIRRRLTKRLFLHENKRLLITFSAGVAEYQTGESQHTVIVRADEALYRAKRNGKNQVVAANVTN
ncbi:MAG: GGDEF domain-containing protein [Nitrosomonas sp.]|nr:GGDEF domain-containing protein [Nitrosomonas sp.]